MNIIAKLAQFTHIILVGGGTGGHIQPVVSLAKRLRNEQYIKNKILWIGGKDSQEENTASSEYIPFRSIPILKLSTTRSPKILLYPIFLLVGIYRAREILKTYKKLGNTVVFSKGGPGSVAVGIAAWSLGLPLHIHESDTIPGRSSQILGKFADTIWLGFDTAKEYFDIKKTKVIGQILDPIFGEEKTKITDNEIQWKTDKTHILVICGSQGARSIFESIIAQFSGDDKYEWIVSLGKLNTALQEVFMSIPNCQAVNWISQANIAHLIPDSDIAITRGSATTLAELSSFSIKKPTLIIVPLPYSAGNHQHYNALEYKKIGHILLEQTHLTELNTIITHERIGNQNK